MPQQTFANSGPSLVGYTLDNGRIEFLSVLGLGAYGVVYLAVDLSHKVPVYLAVKCLLRTGLDSRQRHFQRREITLHGLASRHPNVVSLHKVIEQGDYVFVIMDFFNEGDLFGMITERQRYIGDDALIKKVFLQIVDAVSYCHSMGIFHRDLKPENILCTDDGTRVCIADFGLATSERTSTDFGCGSTFYLSPECQGGLFERLEHYNTATNDLWSLGVILVNLTCGRNPWRQACPSDETFRAFVHNAEFLRTILPISHATNRILKGLFALEPRDRLSLAELRREISLVDTFTMSEDELRTAHSAARAAAAAVRPIPKAAPVAPVAPVVIPQHRQSLVDQVDMDEHQILDEYAADRHPWSGSSEYIDASIIDQIDFSDPRQAAAYQQQQACLPPLANVAAAVSAVGVPTAPPPTIPIHIETFDTESYSLLPSSSQSSSSGDGDIALPFTPEFKPAQEVDQPGVDISSPVYSPTPSGNPWSEVAPIKHIQPAPGFLNVNLGVMPLQPIRDDFRLS